MFGHESFEDRVKFVSMARAYPNGAMLNMGRHLALSVLDKNASNKEYLSLHHCQ